MSQKDDAKLNIGALSMATDVPVETIRTWERRYGFPDSRRNEAGHRIYDVETIEHLRLIREVLSEGYRPSQLKDRSTAELEELLDKTRADQQEPDSSADRSGAEADSDRWLGEWLEPVTELDRERFVGRIRRAYHRMSAFGFLEHRLVPFLHQLGDGWADGRFSVVHEHFVSESIRDFLVDQWRPLSESAPGPPVVLATLPGEKHALALHMVALVAAMADRQIVHLGANTPVEDLATAAVQSSATAVATSVSECSNSATTVSFLSKLRDLVDPDVDILVGGRGVPEGVEEVDVVDDFRELFEMLEQ